MEGFVYFHRKITEWQWYDDPNTFRLFFHLVLTSNHKDNVYRGIEIKRGQVLTSRSKLAEKLNLSEQKIRTSLRKLNKEEITCKSTKKFTIITINHYDTYQSYEKLTNQLTNQQSNQVATKKQPSSNQVVTTNNNVNTENTVNNENKKKESAKINFASVVLSNLNLKDPLLEKALEEYQKVRVKKKCSNSKQAANRVSAKLKDYSNGKIEIMIEMIYKSCDAGWADIYQLKESKPNHKPKDKFKYGRGETF